MITVILGSTQAMLDRHSRDMLILHSLADAQMYTVHMWCVCVCGVQDPVVAAVPGFITVKL